MPRSRVRGRTKESIRICRSCPLFYEWSVPLRGASKSNIVADHRGRPNGKGLGAGDIELLELDPALPNLPQKILEHLDGELLAWAAAIAEAEGCEAGMVADGQRFAVNDTESRAEAAVVDGGLSAAMTRGQPGRLPRD